MYVFMFLSVGHYMFVEVLGTCFLLQCAKSTGGLPRPSGFWVGPGALDFILVQQALYLATSLAVIDFRYHPLWGPYYLLHISLFPTAFLITHSYTGCFCHGCFILCITSPTDREAKVPRLALPWTELDGDGWALSSHLQPLISDLWDGLVL